MILKLNVEKSVLPIIIPLYNFLKLVSMLLLQAEINFPATVVDIRKESLMRCVWMVIE